MGELQQRTQSSKCSANQQGGSTGNRETNMPTAIKGWEKGPDTETCSTLFLALTTAAMSPEQAEPAQHHQQPLSKAS